MRTVLILLLIAVSAHCHSQTLEKLDEKSGYKDLKLEMSEEAFIKQTNAVRIAGGDSVYRSYKLSAPKYMHIDKCEVASVQVDFYRGKLLDVIVEVKGHVNGQCTLDALTAAFGMGKQDDPNVKEYSWKTKKVFMLYSMGNINGKDNSRLALSSVKLFNEYYDYAQKHAQPNGSDF
jgi:hypothetical protein